MKSVYNSLKQPVTYYLKKDILKEGVKAVDVIIQKIKPLEIEDKINISSNKELDDDQIFAYKPSIIQQKINDDFNYTNHFKLNNYNQFGIKKVGLSNALYRHFSTETDKMSDIVPRIHTGGDFGKLVKESSSFVDKSLFIKDVVEDKSEVILITMPRRWGKSLNLDMLKRFLSIEVDKAGNVIPNNQTENYKLFAGGTIEVQDGFNKRERKIFISELVVNSPKALDLQGKCPVIFIDFKDCKGDNFEKVKFNLNKKIADTIENFGYLEVSEKTFSGLTTIGQKYSEILDNTKSGIFETAIKDLSSLLYSYHSKKVWILIDEYDAAANKAYLEFSDKDAKAVSELFRGVLEPALKGNSFLEKGFMTGVQYIVKSGMLSGLNNLSQYNVTSTKYSKHYGINQTEMNKLLAAFNIDTTSTSSLKIKDWYNGYKSNNGSAEKPDFIDKYNIWSVVNYLNNQPEGFKSYWENSSLGAVIDKKILKNPAIKNIVEGLINNQNLVLGKLTIDFGVNDFEILKGIVNKHDQIEIKQDGVDLIFSYLFITGYLTNTARANEYALPNKEIKTEFETKLKDYYNQIFNISPSKFNELTQELDSIFSEQDNEKMSNIITTNFAPKLAALIKELQVYNDNSDKLTVKGVFGNEDLMQSLLNNIAIQVVNAKFASERYTTKSDGRKGRADIVLSKNGKGIVIEMKYNNNTKKSGDIKALAKSQVTEALKQAESYGDLVKNTKTKIFIGCNITDQQEVLLSGVIKVDDKSIPFNYLLDK